MSESTHRILIIGVGSIGERHTRCFLASGRASVGICELNESLRDTIAQRYGIDDAFKTLDDALVSPWDAALIATPAHTHIPIALELARHNIPLLIEKPLSISDEGIEELLNEVKDRELLTAVSYNYRAHPALASMKASLDSGQFGRPLQLYANLGQNFATYRPAYASVYFADHAQGGGGIQDCLTHIINLSEWLIGPVTRIAGDALHQQLPDVEVEDTVHAFARHGSVMASYTMNMYQQPNETIVTVVCEKGTLRFEVNGSCWKWMDEVEGEWHTEEHPLKERDTWYILNANAFLDALEGLSEPLCSLEDGFQTLKVNQALLNSLETEKWETIS